MKWTLALPVLFASATYALSDIIIKARQAVARRGFSDTCAPVNADLPSRYGDIHITACICISSLPDFCNSNGDLSHARDKHGETEILESLTGLINDCRDKKVCQYPQHSKPVCNTHNPCDFTCKGGYEPWPSQHPTQCVCKPPYKECNGKCGSYPHGCPSSAPRNVRRSTPICAPGKEICGVNGGANSNGWECVDTRRDLESCGGCLVPNPFGGSSMKGTDCSQIDHASAVACSNGTCKVSECVLGYVPSPAGNACVPVTLVEPVEGGSLVTQF